VAPQEAMAIQAAMVELQAEQVGLLAEAKTAQEAPQVWQEILGRAGLATVEEQAVVQSAVAMAATAQCM